MSEKDTTASSLPEASDPDTAVETTEEALESRGQLGRDYLWNTAASLMSSLAVVIMGVYFYLMVTCPLPGFRGVSILSRREYLAQCCTLSVNDSAIATDF